VDHRQCCARRVGRRYGSRRVAAFCLCRCRRRARFLVGPRDPAKFSLDASAEGNPAPAEASTEAVAAAKADGSPPAPIAPPALVTQPASAGEKTPPARPLAETAKGTRAFQRARFGLDAGPIVLFSAKGVPPALDVLFCLRWMPWPSVVLRPLVMIPVLSPSVSAAEGSAAVTTWVSGARVDWRVTREDDPWEASVGAGAAAAWIGTKGSANPPYVDSSGNQATAVPFLAAHGARALGSPHLRLGVDGTLGAALPEVGIEFAGRTVATWGRPLAGLAVLLEIDAP
jgi:hypothetical protein